ncbi:MAG: hypothetical protein U0235_14535 [Polyangiaceae bacterium]
MTAHAKLVVLALVACVAGCSVVTALTDLDSRYARDAADGSVSSDAAAVDAALGQDGSATDSGDVDARTDGGVSPCATGTHTLCDDFDTAAALGAAPTWTASLLAQEGATISLATDLPFSAPRALSAAFPADAGGNPAASLSRGFVGPIGALDCSFMLRPETLDAKGLVQLLSITLPPPPAARTPRRTSSSASSTSTLTFASARRSLTAAPASTCSAIWDHRSSASGLRSASDFLRSRPHRTSRSGSVARSPPTSR